MTVGVVLVSTAGVLGYYYLNRKRKPQITLIDPSEKYKLRLVDKEVFALSLFPCDTIYIYKTLLTK